MAIIAIAALAAGCGGSSSSSPPQTPLNDVLVFGGSDGELGSGGIGLESLNTAEVYDTAAGDFEPTGNMVDNRELFSASSLGNQEVLVAGGSQLNFSSNEIVSFNSLNTAEIYNPATEQFQLIPGKLNTDRALAHANQLSGSNQVLISGGLQVNIQVASTTATAALLNSSELFNETTETFQTGPAMTEPRILGTATTLNNGEVLLTGGITESTSNGISISNTAEVYNPTTNTFTATSGPMTTDRALQTANLLPNGDVLITGGISSTPVNPLTGTSVVNLNANSLTLTGMAQALTSSGTAPSIFLNTAELYNPTTGQFTATGDMTDTRIGYTATTLPNGEVLIAGGLSLTVASGTAMTNLGNLLSTLGLSLPNAILTSLNTAMLYNPTTGTFTALNSQMVADRALQSAILLENGEVLITGGHSVDIDLADPNGPINFTTVNTAELFNPETNTFTATGNMGSRRARQVSITIPG